MIKAIRFSKGHVHDFKLYKDRAFSIHDKIKILADLGFLGLSKEHPHVELPHKKTKLKPLTEPQKLENKRQVSKRVLIEHINRDCKIFKICGTKYRGKHKNYEQTWQIVTALVNLKKSTKHLIYATF